MDKCPYCESKMGLFSKEVGRFDQYYGFNGEPSGYSDLDVVCRRKSTPLYCKKCGKRVTTLQEIRGCANEG